MVPSTASDILEYANRCASQIDADRNEFRFKVTTEIGGPTDGETQFYVSRYIDGGRDSTGMIGRLAKGHHKETAMVLDGLEIIHTVFNTDPQKV